MAEVEGRRCVAPNAARERAHLSRLAPQRTDGAPFERRYAIVLTTVAGVLAVATLALVFVH